MRGKNILNTYESNSPNKKFKGRNTELRVQKDRKMCARYYYYSKIHKYNYEECISLVSIEFDLSQRRVIDILTQVNNIIRDMNKERIGIKELQKEFPYFVWKEGR